MGRKFSTDINSNLEDTKITRVFELGMNKMNIVQKTTEINLENIKT